VVEQCSNYGAYPLYDTAVTFFIAGSSAIAAAGIVAKRRPLK
jgi:hypothetical protein